MEAKIKRDCTIVIILLSAMVGIPFYFTNTLEKKTGVYRNTANRCESMAQEAQLAESQLKQYAQIETKLQANHAVRKAMLSATPPDIQNMLIRGGALNPRVVVDGNTIRASFNAKYTTIGSITTDIWNQLPLLQVRECEIRPVGTGSDDTLFATLTIALPDDANPQKTRIEQ